MSLAAVLQQVAQAMPALAGRVQPQTPPQQGQGGALAEPLLQWWQQAETAAGRHFWSTRSFSTLIWQPAYLAVLAVHVGGRALDLRDLRQQIHQGFAAGFFLPEAALLQAPAAEHLQLTAAGLLYWHQQYYAALNRCQPWSARQAACTTVDCVNAALLIAQEPCGWSHARLLQTSQAWQQALGLTEHGRIMLVDMQDTAHTASEGGKVPALERRACCQYFRLAGAGLCDSCPRLPLPERQQRVREQRVREQRAREQRVREY